MLATAASVALLPACGGDDDGGTDPSDPLALAAALPAETGPVVAIDFDGVRETLELEDDFDVATIPDGDGATDALIASYSVSVLPQVSQLAATFREDDPVLTAIDGSQISGAAAGAGAPLTAIVATDQPFDEISAALIDSGFEDAGEGLLTSEAPEASVRAVADLGDGRIVLSEEPEAAEAVAAGEDVGPASAELLDTVPGPVRIGLVPPAGDEIGCVVGYAQGEDPGAGTGSLRVEVDGEPDTSRIDPDVLGPIEVDGDPVADEDSVEFDYDFVLEESPGGIALPAAARIAIGELIDC